MFIQTTCYQSIDRLTHLSIDHVDIDIDADANANVHVNVDPLPLI